ncbi:PQQ-binding-like beta-propeller repeat protein [Segatella copri]|uniref:PQQ-binding-like beta-propeller repeat protein n=1 Tax=Segatella copri TaxID=165179 RepID=UPI001C462718|nr:PQQ-binding-like beta-propeller repeat protein [Segatella copri]WOZ83888.1 PQQ-binding-like beta-propeller repeat protein [Segatella copri]
MKVINSKLAAIGLAAFVFASCSDSNSDPTGGDGVKPEVNSVELTASTPSSVINYKNSTAMARKFFATRGASATNFVTAMPDFPTKPNVIKELNAATDLIYSKDNPTNTYVIKNQNKLDFTGKKIQGVTIFISGDCKMTYNESLGGNTIVLAKGAILEYTGTGSMIQATDKVYGAASSIIKATNSNNNIVVEGELYASWEGQGEQDKLHGGFGAVESKVNPTQNITFKSGAKAYIDGSIRAKNLTIEDGAVVTATRNILNATKVDLAGALKVGGFCKSENLNITGLLDASNANAVVKVTKQLNLENGSLIKANYVNVTNNTYKGEKDHKVIDKVGEAQLNLKNGGQIQIADLGVINVNNLVTDNASAAQIELQGDNAVAVIKADNFTNNGNATINAFATPGTNSVLLLQMSKCFMGTTLMPSSGDLDISASYLDYDKATDGALVERKDEANEQYGYILSKDAKNAKATPKLDLVASFGDNNGMSASCIQTVGNYVYVSYHTHGNGKTNLKGGLEVLHMADNKLVGDQAVQGNTSIDINHVMVDNNKAYIAATDIDKGAFLGVVPLENNVYSTNMTQYVLDALNKNNGIDANCVVKYGDNIVMSSTRGYEFYDSNFGHTYFQTTADAKGLASANGNLYSLLATGKNTTGTVNVFNGIDLSQGKATTTFTTNGNVGPEDGKNTVAVDGTDIYVCQGEEGLVRYDANGKKVWSYKVPVIANQNSEKYGSVKGYCNGVAISGDYVYVAAGGYGVVVLNKKDGTELCHRTAFNGFLENGKWAKANSANYVTIGQDGYIYVAYGKSRVQVFKLTQTK